MLHKRVSIACAVKSAVTNLPLAETKVTLMGTEKSATSNQEGLFFLRTCDWAIMLSDLIVPVIYLKIATS